MKRFIMLLLTFGLLMSISVPCFAAENDLSLSETKGGAGQVVYMVVTLNASVKANTIGVQCEFDENLLTPWPELSSWGKTGVLSAFKAGNIGAWAGNAVEDMKGKLCVLAFQIKEKVAFSDTEVTCTVVLKNGTEEVGKYTAKGKILSNCEHKYGDWTSAGNLGHTRVCSLCGGKNTQMHQWDDGTEAPGQADTTILTTTCLVCLEQKTTEIPAGNKNDLTPNNGGTGSTGSNNGEGSHEHPGVQDQNSQNGNQGTLQNPEHNHDVEAGEKIPDHTHTDDAINADGNSATPAKMNPAVLWIVLGLVAVVFVGCVISIKKKH